MFVGIYISDFMTCKIFKKKMNRIAIFMQLCSGSSQYPQSLPAKVCEIEIKCPPKETECV
jgi:hypothetical protein